MQKSQILPFKNTENSNKRQKREREALDAKSKLPHKNSHFIPLCDNNFSKKRCLAIMTFIYRSDFCCELRTDGGTYVVLNFKLAKETICSWGKSDKLKSFQFLDSLNVVT